MYRALEKLRTGEIDTSQFVREECDRRSRELTASKIRDLQQAHDGIVTSIDADNSTGRFLLSGCNTGSLYIHDLCNETGLVSYTCKLTCKFTSEEDNAHTNSLETVQWYPFDTGLFTTSGLDKKFKIWDGNTLKPVEVINFDGEINRHHICPVPSKNNCLVALATREKEVYLVDMRTGNCVQELRGHKNYVMCCLFSPTDENILTSGGGDCRTLLWDIRMSKGYLKSLLTGDKELPDKSHKSCIKGLCFTRDGRYVVSVGRCGKIKSWDVLYGKIHLKEFNHKIHDHKLTGIQLAISMNSSLLFVPNKSVIDMYNFRTGEILKSLRGHYGHTKCCYFHPFNIELYSGGADQVIIPYCAENEILHGYEEIHNYYKYHKPVDERVIPSRRNTGWVDSDSDD